MLLKRLREYTEGKIQLRLETMRVNYKDLIADPEFTLEYLQDPIKYRKYQIFQSIKMSYMKPVAVILLYIFEKKLNFPIEDIYFHDLIGGEPAYPQGISGRGIDYVMIFKKMPDINLVKEVEQFIDDLIGAAITNYFWKKSLCDCNIPFNKIIKHNLIGIIPILSLQKANYGLEGGFFTPPVKKADLPKYRKRLELMEKNIGRKFDYLEEYFDQIINF